MRGTLETQDERSAAAVVQQMFTDIAPRYDLLNHLLSFNVDRLWWRRTARTFAPILQRPGSRALDLCCGTGDMTFALARVRGDADVEIIGADFSAAMLHRARAKSAGMANPPQWLEADALALPLPDASFDLVVSAFGFRNLANYDRGLHEIARVLKAGGEVGILDFGQPTGILGKLYNVYFKRVLPRVGTLISGVRGPYEYLPASVSRFPSTADMLERMQAAGFRKVSWTPYTFGIAGLFRGTRA
jgi:demethylmenaquinone methyltransferase/2-methoxy-6-polyprenyl-1,4-benzoquinol methylase